MEHSQFRVAVLGMVVLALLAGSFLAGRALAGSRVVRAQSEVSLAAPADPAYTSYSCSALNNVAAFDNRIHVRCVTANGSIQYYAYPTTGSNGYTANRMLAVAQTAFALGEGLVIFYQASTSYNPPGCNTGDCRLLVGLSMVK
jgi:hypothetical protein